MVGRGSSGLRDSDAASGLAIYRDRGTSRKKVLHDRQNAADRLQYSNRASFKKNKNQTNRLVPINDLSGSDITAQP